ncbi:alpha-1,4-glucan--maltose-1-phosphate maltosyltransferase [Microlunatus capsulatus]|uniref:alpha-1,4-glucan--maltose-1-phosphate maltosyltransferase n=1 Tax=Microlunatus capsulatus TaxID=99117 RepID=UPI0027DDA4C7|nr:alpha-1,4-glucan--maltose-1-phosphate maltosyltransferase [Microlunatus capsulatus]
MTPPERGTAFGRIPVTKVSPVIEGGAYPAKASVGEAFAVRATVFREGHDAVGASVVLTDPTGRERVERMHPSTPAGFDWWAAEVVLETEGAWTFRVEGWDDPWETWVHNAEIKIPAGIDVALVCTEGKALFAGAAARAEAAGDTAVATLLREAGTALDSEQQVEDRLEDVLGDDVREAMAVHGPRELVSPSPDFPVFVDRREALYASWYEFFPRSQGAHFDPDTQRWVSGTFDSSHERLEAAAAMGFDVVYLPPIHPIGTAFRKGPNNTLTPGPADPGSPWAIGNVEGGHDAIHPDLGDFDSFDRFVAKAKSLGLEIAMDFALQASPDHPWVKDHPEWFSQRADGSIAYAENPPKKYQDIYPINFDRDRDGIYAESLRILQLWMSHGVRIFRVDNPHTKPVDFWAWITAEVRRTDPDVLFLAEAFTKPAMMHALGKAGFHQGYTYFTWRNEKWELEEYLTELTTESDAFFRPNFFVNTPDILPTFLQWGGKTAFTIRAVLAATLAPTWGVYSGFELFENAVLAPGREEYLDSEKFQYRPRDWEAAEASGENLNLLLGTLNAIRREHPALQQLRNLHFHHAPHDSVIVYSKRTGDDVVLTVVNLDPLATVESEIYLDMEALGLGASDVFLVHEELTGQTWRWGQRAFVRLTVDDPAHVLSIVRPGPRQLGNPVTGAAEVGPDPEPTADGPAPAATTTGR